MPKPKSRKAGKARFRKAKPGAGPAAKSASKRPKVMRGGGRA